MNRQEMIDRLKAGESPLDVSIRKWTAIVDALKHKDRECIDYSSATCELCYTNYPSCQSCPYYVHFGYRCDDESGIADDESSTGHWLKFDDLVDEIYGTIAHSVRPDKLTDEEAAELTKLAIAMRDALIEIKEAQ